MATPGERQAIAQEKMAIALASISASLTKLVDQQADQAAIAKALSDMSVAFTNLVTKETDPTTGQVRWWINVYSSLEQQT